MYAEAFSMYMACQSFIAFQSKRKKHSWWFKFISVKKKFWIHCSSFFKSFRKMEWSLRLKLISKKKKELWYSTECKKVYCITIIVWCIHIFDVHGWMKLDPRSILNLKSESLVYCCISLVYTNLLAKNIYGYRFKSTCRPKSNKINQNFIVHSLNL